MLAANARIDVVHVWASKFYQWIVNAKGVLYWSQDGKNVSLGYSRHNDRVCVCVCVCVCVYVCVCVCVFLVLFVLITAVVPAVVLLSGFYWWAWAYLSDVYHFDCAFNYHNL